MSRLAAETGKKGDLPLYLTFANPEKAFSDFLKRRIALFSTVTVHTPRTSEGADSWAK